MLPRSVAAVVFDMDGLLIDSERVIRDAMMQVAPSFGAHLPVEVFQRMVGLPNDASDAVAAAHFGRDFPLADYYGEVSKRAHAVFEVEVAVKAGVAELLDHLDEAGLPAAVCTSSSHDTVRRMLTANALLPRFRTIVAAGDYPRGKPNPDPFLTAATRLGVDPLHCLALEDSHNGVRAAHAAGMMTVMVPDLLEATEEMQALCVRIADTLHDVRDMLTAAAAASRP